MGADMDDTQKTELLFPPDVTGKRSSLALGQQVIAAALREAADEEARRAEQEKDWRRGYIHHVVAQERLACRDAAAAIAMAAGGLDALYERMQYRTGDNREISLGQAVRSGGANVLAAHDVAGQGTRDTRIRVPWRDSFLTGDALVAKLADWEARGIIEPSAYRAIETVLKHPEWLELDDLTFVLLGAGAELSPAPFLASHGAHLVAVDLPGGSTWTRLRQLAAATPCRLTLPGHGEEAGANLLTDLPALAAWLADLPGPLVLGNYAYADGARHLLLAAAGDAIAEFLCQARDDVAVAYLGTPTDAYAVPAEVSEAVRSDPRRARGWISRSAATLSGERLCAPNLSEIITSHDDSRWAIYDGLVGLQGPNYALAKRIQRWRCLVLADKGNAVSFNVAPAALTHSVVDHPAFAAAYAGASLFGAEIFPPNTAAALMALMLVHDLRSASDTAPPDNPASLIASGALHGGFWRSPFRPRTVIGLAAAKGLPAAFRRRRKP